MRFTAGFEMRPGGGVTMAELARLYQAADVHLLSSYGEGFGLPTLQAAAAGAVPLAVDASASSELVRGHGVPVPVESTMSDEFGLVRTLLSREAAAEAIATLHDDPAGLASASRRSREFALGYGWDDIAGEWERHLAESAPRRRPVRSRSYSFVSGQSSDPAAPAAVRSALAPAVSGLPDGAHVQVRIAERRHGEASGRILWERSTPDRSCRSRSGSRRCSAGVRAARVGWLLAGPREPRGAGRRPGDLPGDPDRRDHPGLDITTAERIPLDELAAACRRTRWSWTTAATRVRGSTWPVPSSVRPTTGRVRGGPR